MLFGCFAWLIILGMGTCIALRLMPTQLTQWETAVHLLTWSQIDAGQKIMGARCSRMQLM